MKKIAVLFPYTGRTQLLMVAFVPVALGHLETNFGEIEMNVHVCSICGMIKTETENWFLLWGNRWQDRFKILHWNDELAKRDYIFYACSPGHVKDFLYAWVTSGELPSADKIFLSSAIEGASNEVSSIGDLFIHRPSLKNSPEGLKSVLEALDRVMKSALEIQGDQLPPKIQPQKFLKVAAACAS